MRESIREATLSSSRKDGPVAPAFEDLSGYGRFPPQFEDLFVIELVAIHDTIPPLPPHRGMALPRRVHRRRDIATLPSTRLRILRQ
jgi:hypothetical protein